MPTRLEEIFYENFSRQAELNEIKKWMLPRQSSVTDFCDSS